MRLKFPDLSHLTQRIDHPLHLKLRAIEISMIAGNLISKLEQPKLFKRLKERVLQVWRM